MPIDTSKVIEENKRADNDTGSPEVQVALITARIEMLSGHFKTHKKDHHSRRGLLMMVNRRRSLLDYLHRKDADRYKALLVRGDIKSLAAAAMRWVLDNPHVSLVLAGSRQLEEILDCAAASDAAPYTAEELAAARRLHVKDFPPA